jgi:formylglycine-generating enzyme required for sulfatase activity
MVVVPAGSFTMGSPANERDRWNRGEDQVQVSIAAPFAAGKFAVTFDEWDTCVAGGGCNRYRPNDLKWGRGKRPVFNVNWNDAKAYVAWLSKNTGKAYRLLSEAEREFVTRAGTITPYWWGIEWDVDHDNYRTEASEGYEPEECQAVQTTQEARDCLERLHPRTPEMSPPRARVELVDKFKPNPWGLYSVHGNVWDWTEDCWNDSNMGNPGNGSARITGDCSRRVLRGGSWNTYPGGVRAASRNGKGTSGKRYNDVGFRVARTLNP